jgi:uncharacterized membrane protein
MATASSFLSDKEKHEIALTIHEAELHTRGEIRLYIEKKCKGDVMERALKIFHQLNMHHTKERNGVLIYVAYVDHVFAILGDKGIHEKVPEHFWDDEGAARKGFCGRKIHRRVEAGHFEMRRTFKETFSRERKRH